MPPHLRDRNGGTVSLDLMVAGQVVRGDGEAREVEGIDVLLDQVGCDRPDAVREGVRRDDEVTLDLPARYSALYFLGTEQQWNSLGK